jgi:hypothetical protein
MDIQSYSNTNCARLPLWKNVSIYLITLSMGIRNFTTKWQKKPEISKKPRGHNLTNFWMDSTNSGGARLRSHLCQTMSARPVVPFMPLVKSKHSLLPTIRSCIP